MNLQEGKDRILEALPTLEFSADSREILRIALDEAATFGELYISTKGLLIGISQVGGLGEKLRTQGVNPKTIRETERRIFGFGDTKVLQIPEPSTAIQRWEQIPLTLRLRKIGAMVTKKAISDNREVIEPQDILAAIVDEGAGIGARILRELGFDKNLLK